MTCVLNDIRQLHMSCQPLRKTARCEVSFSATSFGEVSKGIIDIMKVILACAIRCIYTVVEELIEIAFRSIGHVYTGIIYMTLSLSTI